jgi:hypothetical protein
MKKFFVSGWIIVVFLMLTAYSSFAQGRGHDKHDKAAKKEYKAYKKGYKQGAKTNYVRRGGPPSWAPAHGYRAKNHVYFPDYYTFYDPRRNGYVYWNNNTWSFSPSVPSFMANIDLGRARIQVLGDLPLTTQPEPDFNRYYGMYPPSGSININIPHPPFPRR